MPLDADDLLTPDALQQLALGFERDKCASCIFSDEDIWENGAPSSPYRRPGFDPILNAADSYIFHVCAFNRERALALGVYTEPGAEFCHDWDTVLRFEQARKSIRHVPLVLYHWRAHQDSSSNSGGTNEASLRSVQHTLERIIARQTRPDLYEVKLFPIHRGIDQYAIVRRETDPMPMALLHVAPDGSPPPDLRHLALGAVCASFADDGGELVDQLDRLPPEITLILVLRSDCAVSDEAALWEAMRLFEMHPDVALAGGRVLDGHGTVVAASQPAVPATSYVDKRRDDPGAFAMALKPQTALSVPNSFFFCRRDVLRDAAISSRSGVWAERLTTFVRTRDLRIAYSPLIEAVQTPNAAADPSAAEKRQRARRALEPVDT